MSIFLEIVLFAVSDQFRHLLDVLQLSVPTQAYFETVKAHHQNSTVDVDHWQCDQCQQVSCVDKCP